MQSLPDCQQELRYCSAYPSVFYNKWYFDELYDAMFVKPAVRLGNFSGYVATAIPLMGLARQVSALVYQFFWRLFANKPGLYFIMPLQC